MINVEVLMSQQDSLMICKENTNILTTHFTCISNIEMGRSTANGTVHLLAFSVPSHTFFSSPRLKAQDELLDHLQSVILCPLSVHPCPSLNDYSSETPGPIFFKLHVEPSVKGGLKICTNGYDLLVKMATMPIYGKNT